MDARCGECWPAGVVREEDAEEGGLVTDICQEVWRKSRRQRNSSFPPKRVMRDAMSCGTKLDHFVS